MGAEGLQQLHKPDIPENGRDAVEPEPEAESEPEPAAVAETGLASWYGPGFHRRKTASGERFDMFAMTAAHRTLAFGTLICVRSRITGRAVVVRVNDRGPRAPDRVVDLSRAAAIELGMHGLGLKPVDVVPLAKGQSTCEGD
jgi:rare lipoprotein A